MNFIRQMINQVRQLIKELPPIKRITILLSVLAVVMCLILLVTWASRKNYVPLLASGVDPAERTEIVKTLEQERIPCRMEGATLTVPESERERAIALISSAGLAQDKGVDFSYLFATDFVSDQGRQDRQYKIKVEEKLRHMLLYFPFIRGAQVQITPGDDTYSFAKDRPAKASVQVQLRSGRELSESQVRSIAQLVANAWKNLDVKDVIIVDTNTGRGYTVQKREIAGLDEIEDQKHKLEKAYQEKVESLIPFSRKVVAVDIKLSRKRVSIREDDVDPQKRATIKERTREHSDNSAEKGPAAPGITANVTETIPAAVTGVVTASEENESERENIFAKKTTTTEILPGDIEEITVAVTLDTEEATRGMDGKVARNESESQQNFSRTVANLTALISKACNIKDPANIAVSAIPFPRLPEIPAPPAGWRRLWAMTREHSSATMGLVLLLMMAGLMIYVTRRSLPGLPVELKEDVAGKEERVMEEELAEEEARFRMEHERTEKLKERIEQLVSEEPYVAAGLIKRWIAK